MDLLGSLGYVGDALDKPGRAVRGLLAGKADEGLASLPFSDSLGITNPGRATSGRDLTDQYGLTRRGDQSIGSHAIGFGAGALLDPLNLIGVGGAAKGVGALRTVAKQSASHADELKHLDLLNSLHRHGNSPHFGLDDFPDRAAGFRGKPETGSGVGNDLLHSLTGPAGPTTGLDVGGHGFGLRFDGLDAPPLGLSRSDPDWINNRTWYHGSNSQGLTAANLDPTKTDRLNQLGRGIYLGDDAAIAREHAEMASMAGNQGAAYAAHPEFGKILDLSQKPHQAPGDTDLLDAIARQVGIDPARLAGIHMDMRHPEGTIRELYKAILSRANRRAPLDVDPGISALKSHGIDAVTAPYIDGAPQWMLSGLDPNDVLGVGRATPFRKFERFGG